MTSPKRPRVLVADDHPEMVKAICRLLALDCDVVQEGVIRVGDAVTLLDEPTRAAGGRR